MIILSKLASIVDKSNRIVERTPWPLHRIELTIIWTSCQTRQIAGCASTTNVVYVFPAPGGQWCRWRGKRPRHSWRMRNLQFLPEASIGLRVWSLPASVHPSVRQSVRHQVCLSDNSSPVQARITKFRPSVKNTLVKIPIVLWGDWPDFQGQIWLQYQNLPNFKLVRAITHLPFKLKPPNLDQRWKITWLRSLLLGELIELTCQILTQFQNPV